MTIEVKEVSENLKLEFVKLGPWCRLWIRDDSLWYPTVGWCPHQNIGGGECRDCSLVLEDD